MGGQGQQVKIIQQGTNQPTSNVSVNIGGQNVNLSQISLPNLQLVKGTKVSSPAVQQDQHQMTSQHQVTFQQGQGHDMVAMQQRPSMTSQANMTSQQNFIAGGQQQQILVSGTNQVQTGVSNPENIANQNYKGLSNMQQLMQKLRGSGNKVVTLQTVTDSSNVQTTLPHAQPLVTKVSTVSPNVNIVQIKREKIDTSANSHANITSSGPNTIKQLMLQKQAGTLGTAKIIVKQEPAVKTEPSSFTNSYNVVSQSSVQSAVNLEGLLSTSSAFTTAHVSTVTMTVSQSAMSVSSNFLSNIAQQSVSSVDIKPDIKPFISQSYGAPQTSSISSFVNTISPKRYGASPNSSSSILSALTGSNNSSVASSVASTTNSLSGNLNSISPQETPTAKPQMNGGSKPAGAMLQTIHLPPELQQHFQKIQFKIREVNSDRSLSMADRQNKLQQLNMIQRKILLRGRVLATTRAEPHHIQQGLQALASPPHDQSKNSSQTTQVSQSIEQISSVSQQTSSLAQQLPGQQLPGQQFSQQLVDSSPQSMQTLESGRRSVPSALETIPSGRLSVTSAQQMFMSDHHQSSSSQHGILSGLNTPMNQHTSGHPMSSGHLALSDQPPLSGHQPLSAHPTSSGNQPLSDLPPSSGHQLSTSGHGLPSGHQASSGQKPSGHSFLSAVEESLSPTGHPAYLKQPTAASVVQHLSHEQVPRLQSPGISSNMVTG